MPYQDPFSGVSEQTIKQRMKRGVSMPRDGALHAAEAEVLDEMHMMLRHLCHTDQSGVLACPRIPDSLLNAILGSPEPDDTPVTMKSVSGHQLTMTQLIRIKQMAHIVLMAQGVTTEEIRRLEAQQDVRERVARQTFADRVKNDVLNQIRAAAATGLTTSVIVEALKRQPYKILSEEVGHVR